MLLGAVAGATQSGIGSAPGAPAQLALMDFTTGTYELGGVGVALTDLLGGGLDAGEITSRGMRVVAANANRPDAATDLLNLFGERFQNGFTLVVDLESQSATSDYLFVAMDDTVYASATELLIILGNSDVYNQDADLSFGGTVAEFRARGFNREVYTIGLPLGGGNYRSFGSINGSTADVDETDFSQFAVIGVPARITIGYNPAGSGDELESQWIRRIIIYPPLDEAAIEALSAISEDPGTPYRVGGDDVLPIVATSVALDIPADVLPDDLLIACIYHRDTITPPAGWTLVQTHSGTASAILQYESVYSRVAVSGDEGTVATFTQASSLRCGGTLAAFRRDESPLAVLSSATANLDAAGANITATGYHQIAMMCSPFTTAANSPTTTTISITPSTGWTRLSPGAVVDNRHGVFWKIIELPDTQTGNINSTVGATGAQAGTISLLIG
jgi:hypothetical protein